MTMLNSNGSVSPTAGGRALGTRLTVAAIALVAAIAGAFAFAVGANAETDHHVAGSNEESNPLVGVIDAPAEDCFTMSDEFDGDSVHPKWSFRWGGTNTPPAIPTVSDGNLNLQLGSSEIDTTATGPIGFIGQPLPDGDFVIEAKITGDIAADNTSDPQYAQAGLMLYQTDDNFVKTG
jgi:hypothetical protein